MKIEEFELVANRCWLELQAMGITLKVVRDLNQANDLYASLNRSLGASTNPKRLLLTETNCYSIFGFQSGEPAMGFIVRVDDLGDEDAHSFLRRSVETIFEVSVTKTIGDVYRGQRWGKIGYFGDLRTVGRPGIGSRGEKIIRYMSTYGHFRAFNDFDTDVHYSFLRGRDYRNTLPYGFLKVGPFPWRTNNDMYKDGSPEVMGIMRREWIPELSSLMQAYLPDLVDVDQEPRLMVAS